MRHELFVEQPVLDLKEGVKVSAETELTYKTDTVEQHLKQLRLDTTMDSAGSNGINTYKSRSHVAIHLNPGDILLFDESRGYYLPAYPVTSIDDAISDMESLRSIPRYKG